VVLIGLMLVLSAGCQGAAQSSDAASPSETTAPVQGTNTPEPTPTRTPFPTQPVPPEGTVTIEYLGNSSIIITASDGTRIICDPYNTHPAGLISYPRGLTANAVTISHAHPDHNNSGVIDGSPEVLRSVGVYQFGIVTVTGYDGREGSPGGPSDLRNIIFVFQIGDIKIVHMGDSGVITDPATLAAIQNADVIFTNIDGYVLQSRDLWPFLEQIGARTYIPTHFTNAGFDGWQGAPTLEAFLSSVPEDLTVVTFDGVIQVSANMPRQVAGVTPSGLND
jgi:L-ascorbate metabolism protein UlaG (beta-lactamase superfamily)